MIYFIAMVFLFIITCLLYIEFMKDLLRNEKRLSIIENKLNIRKNKSSNRTILHNEKM